MPHRLQGLADQKQPALALDIVQQLAQDGHGPSAPYAFDHGVLSLERSRGIAPAGQQGGRELEGARQRHWQGQWQRVATGAHALRQAHPDSFRAVRGRCRHGQTKALWVLTKVVRRKREGRKRRVIVPAQADRGDTPRWLLTDALHGESGRVIEPWRERWTADILQAFGTQVWGLEAAQVRQEEAGTRHCRLRCVAPALLQQAPAAGAATDRCACAQGTITIGQRVRTIAREALQSLLKLVEQVLAQGQSCAHILGV